jgi:glycosyltransferase involved in cell wall biosynthesis
VSVVIPVFNRERFVGAAIDTVRAQSYDPVEILVVDDGSTDASAEVAERHGATRVLRLPHAGVSAARNAGIEAARGELIAFLDSDDLWTTDRLALQVEHLIDDPEAGFVLAYAVLFADPDDPRPDWLTDDWFAGVKIVDLPDAPATGPDMAGPVPYALTMLARAELFDQLGGFDTSLELGEDIEWLLRATDAGVPYGMIPHVVAYKRVHSGSVSNRVAEGLASILRVLRSSVARKRAAT